MSGSIIVKIGGGANSQKINRTKIIEKKPVSECSIAIDGTKFCSKPSIIKKIGKSIGIKVTDTEQILEESKVKLGCGTEKCVLEQAIKIAPMPIKEEVRESLKDDFKPIGPADSTALLSNIDIDGILSQMTKKWDASALHFHMIDFDKYENGNTKLNRVNLADEINKNLKTFSVVLNTDKYESGGIHWFCLFGDFRGKGTPDDPYTLEYFNSSGEYPRPSVSAWLHKQHKLISNMESKPTVVIKQDMPIAHQKGNTECGVYSLYYLISRIKNEKDKNFFETVEIPDDEMTEFRKSLFSIK